MDGLPDECEIAQAQAQDCDLDGIPDACAIDSGAAQDCDINGIPDSCQFCWSLRIVIWNAILDICQIANGSDSDCDSDGLLDSCAIDLGVAFDCDIDGAGRVWKLIQEQPVIAIWMVFLMIASWLRGQPPIAI